MSRKSALGHRCLERLIQGRPTLIILDEIARHLRTARATPVANSTLEEQVAAFLFSLMYLAAASNSLVFVYSLASAADTFADETTDLQELIQASARQERVLSPSSDVEIDTFVKAFPKMNNFCIGNKPPFIAKIFILGKNNPTAFSNFR